VQPFDGNLPTRAAAVLAATFVAALLALWLTRRSLASFIATMRFRVGLQTQGSGSLYHELAT
jgi:hypothetical protein